MGSSQQGALASTSRRRGRSTHAQRSRSLRVAPSIVRAAWGLVELHEIERAPSSPTLLPKSSSTHRGNSDRRRTSQCTREAVSRRTARRCTDRPDHDESTYRSLQRAPPRAGRTPHHGARQSRAGCPAHIFVRVRCQRRTERDDARPIAMRGGASSALWSGTHLEAGASHSTMATVSWKPLMRAPTGERRRCRDTFELARGGRKGGEEKFWYFWWSLPNSRSRGRRSPLASAPINITPRENTAYTCI